MIYLYLAVSISTVFIMGEAMLNLWLFIFINLLKIINNILVFDLILGYIILKMISSLIRKKIIILNIFIFLIFITKFLVWLKKMFEHNYRF